MHTINSEQFNLRTDLIIETKDNYKNSKSKTTEYNNIQIEEGIDINNNFYQSILFKDITDKDHFKEVEKYGIISLKKMLETSNLLNKNKILIIGLGNKASTPDALGPLTINKTLVTAHLFKLGEVEVGYKEVSTFSPGVTGATGIETFTQIKSLTEAVKPDFIIAIDALAAKSTSRLNKVIQISNKGISPGSGVGNNRKELSQNTLNIPIIAIGIPTVAYTSTIVYDTFSQLMKYFSYKIDNINTDKLKLIMPNKQNYFKHKNNLTKQQRKEILGTIGNLEEDELKTLITEVLEPIDHNLLITPTEIDFLIEKQALLLSNIINKTLHKNFNPTK